MQQSGDYLIRQLRQREKVEEDRFFAQQDRQLIEQLHRQGQETSSDSGRQDPATPADH
ncbi:MAG: hypothetical protein R3310_11660 [Candidatus Competibacteraceae bacterium]|nr:hypothetical protein [Candidatus Competibacteraceae bacterium]